jgi:hypothetical protein
MNLTDELQKLADLRQQGHLTEQEFTEAKQKLLVQGPDVPPPPPSKIREEGISAGVSQIAKKTYWSSRWSKDNLFFRDSMVLASDGILFRKGRLFGSKEEHINYRAVASFRINNGIFLSTISIETSGGSQPIFVNGIWKSEAKEIQDTIRAFQERAANRNST